MYTHSIRGAVQLEEKSLSSLEEAVWKLTNSLMKQNRLEEHQIVHIIFTQTTDLDMGNPATVLRTHGFSQVPLLCTQEPIYPKNLPRTVRILITYMTENPKRGSPIYLGNAQKLREDL